MDPRRSDRARRGANAPRVLFPGQLLDALKGLLGPGNPGLRLNLFGSQIVGVVMIRAVFAAEPLASTPARQIAEAVAPTLTRYLVGPLKPSEAEDAGVRRPSSGA